MKQEFNFGFRNILPLNLIFLLSNFPFIMPNLKILRSYCLATIKKANHHQKIYKMYNMANQKSLDKRLNWTMYYKMYTNTVHQVHGAVFRHIIWKLFKRKIHSKIVYLYNAYSYSHISVYYKCVQRLVPLKRNCSKFIKCYAYFL